MLFAFEIKNYREKSEMTKENENCRGKRKLPCKNLGPAVLVDYIIQLNKQMHFMCFAYILYLQRLAEENIGQDDQFNEIISKFCRQPDVSYKLLNTIISTRCP